VEAEASTVLASLAPPAPVAASTGSAPSAAALSTLSRCLASGDLTSIHVELARFAGSDLSQLRALISDYQYERAIALIAGMA
jgi:hypothetical protein